MDAAAGEMSEETVEAPKCVRWYPNRLAWQFSYSRQQLRRPPHLEQIHEFVKERTSTAPSRARRWQSMIPALFLDIEPSHVVLDMCAAPGSKTFQLLEMLHGSLGDNTAIPKGFVIANDVDMKRCNLLTHQTKRVNSPGLLVTNHEAQNFRDYLPGGRTFPFDAILTDVPCSGDGTMRKAPDIWPRWTVGNGNGLHPQLKIALRAAQLLKVGGRLVRYSTCTFNPIEDEAVVAAMLKDCDGALELLDVSKELPEPVTCGRAPLGGLGQVSKTTPRRAGGEEQPHATMSPRTRTPGRCLSSGACAFCRTRTTPAVSSSPCSARSRRRPSPLSPRRGS